MKLSQVAELAENTETLAQQLFTNMSMPTLRCHAEKVLEQRALMKSYIKDAEQHVKNAEQLATFYRSNIMYTMWKTIVRHDFVKVAVRRTTAALASIKELEERIQISEGLSQALFILANSQPDESSTTHSM